MRKATWFASVLLSVAVSVSSFSGALMSAVMPVCAEEEYYEEEYYDDGYYEEEYYEEDYDDGGSNEEEYKFEADPTVDTNEIKGWPQGGIVDADAAIVMDADTGTVLYAKHMYDQKYPASITKIMTVLLALEHGNLEDKVKFSEYAVYSIEFGSAHLGLTEGEELTLEQCLYGIMLASANEISNAVAEYVAGDVDKFADMMNAKSAELGCTNTHFVNPNGLHEDDHYVCARDMALITQEALKYDKFREIINTDEYHYPPTNLVKEDRYFVNHHQFLMDESYDGIIGGKTGYTDQAFNTLVTCIERDGMTLIGVVLHAPGIESQYGDTRRILDYGFDNFEHVSLANATAAKNNLEIVGIEDPEELKKIQEADFTQEPFTFEGDTVVTVPKDTDVSTLKCKMDFSDSIVSYYYNDQKVGEGTFAYTGVWAAETEPETEAVTEKETVKEAVTERETENITDIKSKTNDFIDTMKQGFGVIGKLLEQNPYVAPIVGGILLIVFVPLLILALMRHYRYQRILKVREEEAAYRRRMEDEINNKTPEQIEAELRAREMEIQMAQEINKRVNNKPVDEAGSDEGEE